jgi:hypothetical protein
VLMYYQLLAHVISPAYLSAVSSGALNEHVLSVN